MIEMVVARLGLDSASKECVVVLREKDGTRVLPIWIGKREAESILLEMNNVKRERPLTHDLCKALVLALGGTLRRVSISRVEHSTYYAEMHLEGHSGWVQLDARPSDAIAIALRLGAPIFAASELLSSDSDDQSLASPLPTAADSDLTSEQLKEYLAALRPEDFGKFKP